MSTNKIHKKQLLLMSLTSNVASLALAIESLEGLLVEKGILQDNELLERLAVVGQKHYAKGEFIPPGDD